MRNRTVWRTRRAARAVAAAGIAALVMTALTAAGADAHASRPAPAAARQRTATPIKHLVVIFQENVSFDHYFGTYPVAANTDGQPFHAAARTPRVNGLSGPLLTSNPNLDPPKRLGPAQAATCDQDHGYTAEQRAFDGGLMDAFVQNTDVEDCAPPLYSTPGLVMDYYDGNTVTALWNYAQRFAMSDNSFGTVFGPSTPGALNLVSGQSHGGYAVNASGAKVSDPSVVVAADSAGVGTVIADPDPAYDDCANTHNHLAVPGRNIGDLLNAHGVSWGWFQGGFRPTGHTATGAAVCGATHHNIVGATVTDYSPHHEPFEYYPSTANPHHFPPSSAAAIGRTDQANHQYDLADFSTALSHHNLPAVSFLKAAEYQDGHAGYSNPIDEQHFLVSTLNALQRSPEWADTAVVISYDDSDGWYDHVMPPIVNPSHDAANDALSGPGNCGHGTPLGGYADRCGYGPRLPLLVISPYSRVNYVDHAVTDQSSMIRFVEDNWLGGQRIGDSSYDALAGSLSGLFDFRHPHPGRLILDPATGRR